MQIIVNSCYKYHKHTLPIIIEALKETGLPDILCIIGDSPSPCQVIESTVHKVFVPYNSFDLTAFIYVCETNFKKDFFYLHDTCKPGPNFGPIVKDRLKDFTQDCAYLTNSGPSMNIGYYNINFVKSHSDLINTLKVFTTTPEELLHAKGLALTNEDFLIKKTNNKTTIARGRNTEHHNNIYSDNYRIREYFPDVDLYKYKANWDLAHHKINLQL